MCLCIIIVYHSLKSIRTGLSILNYIYIYIIIVTLTGLCSWGSINQVTNQQLEPHNCTCSCNNQHMRMFRWALPFPDACRTVYLTLARFLLSLHLHEQALSSSSSDHVEPVTFAQLSARHSSNSQHYQLQFSESILGSHAIVQ